VISYRNLAKAGEKEKKRERNGSGCRTWARLREKKRGEEKRKESPGRPAHRIEGRKVGLHGTLRSAPRRSARGLHYKGKNFILNRKKRGKGGGEEGRHYNIWECPGNRLKK